MEANVQQTALNARWPEAVNQLSTTERDARVRTGHDTVLLDNPADPSARRGFVRVVLRVPVGTNQGQVYGVFVEVDQIAYQALKQAYQTKVETTVWGRLATRLPLLEDAFGSEVEIAEDGSDRRARVVAAKHRLLRNGPDVGPIEQA